MNYTVERFNVMANPSGKILRPLRARLDRFLSGAPQDDPFYLSNRTVAQKARIWLLIGIPCLVVIGLVAFALSRRGGAEDVRTTDLTPAQLAAKMLPDYSKTVRLAASDGVNVDEVQVQHSDPPKLIGVVKNNTGHVVNSADIVCELLSPRGSRLGAVTAHVGEIAPHMTARFEVEIAQDTARSATVTEIRVN
jgi:hypothetical protein